MHLFCSSHSCLCPVIDSFTVSHFLTHILIPSLAWAAKEGRFICITLPWWQNKYSYRRPRFPHHYWGVHCWPCWYNA